MSTVVYSQFKINEKADEIERLIKMAMDKGEYDISYTFSAADPYYVIDGVIGVLEDRGYYIKSYHCQDRKIFLWWED